MDVYLPIAEISVNLYRLFALGGMVGMLSGMFGVVGAQPGAKPGVKLNAEQPRVRWP